MKKLLYLYLIGNLTVGTIAQGVTSTTPKWLSSKIINTTNVPAQITVNYIPDCSKIVSTKDRSECLAQGGNTSSARLVGMSNIVLTELVSLVGANKQCPQPHGTYENSIQVSFPTEEPGSKTYSPITLTIAPEDLQKGKTFTIRQASANQMTIK